MARRKTSKEYWIQGAVKRPGKLKKWLKRNKRRVVAAIKEDPFTRDGKIKATALEKLRRTKFYEKLPAKRKREIILTITLRRLSRK